VLAILTADYLRFTPVAVAAARIMELVDWVDQVGAVLVKLQLERLLAAQLTQAAVVEVLVKAILADLVDPG
jgi:hypothetical protein